MKHKVWMILCAALIGCATAGNGSGNSGTAASGANVNSVNDITGTDWFLQEIRLPGRTIVIDRNKLEADGMGDAFNLRFEGERLSGKAAPNRYTAPCTWGEDGSLRIGPAAATRMAALREPDALKEQEFFNYLAGVNRWALTRGRLELTAAVPSGAPAVMVFVRR